MCYNVNVNFEAMREEIENILNEGRYNGLPTHIVAQQLLNLHSVSYRRELLKGFMKHIEKDGAISFRDYDWTIRLFEEDNKTLL